MRTMPNDFNFHLGSYKDSLRIFAFGFTQNDEDADDLVQETMLKALRFASNFKPGTNLRGWLYMIMRNTYINNYRRMNLSKKFMNYSVDISTYSSPYGASQNDGLGKCLMNDLHSALNQLPAQYYLPFIKYFEGFKYHEIAQELSIPIGTVKTRIHVARGILKQELKIYKDQFFHDGAPD